MGRPKKPWPPTLGELKGQTRVWWHGRWHRLGPADDEQTWKAVYARLLQLWAGDPHAAPLSHDPVLGHHRPHTGAPACPPGVRALSDLYGRWLRQVADGEFFPPDTEVSADLEQLAALATLVKEEADEAAGETGDGTASPAARVRTAGGSTRLGGPRVTAGASLLCCPSVQ